MHATGSGLAAPQSAAGGMQLEGAAQRRTLVSCRRLLDVLLRHKVVAGLPQSILKAVKVAQHSVPHLQGGRPGRRAPANEHTRACFARGAPSRCFKQPSRHPQSGHTSRKSSASMGLLRALVSAST